MLGPQNFLDAGYDKVTVFLYPVIALLGVGPRRRLARALMASDAATACERPCHEGAGTSKEIRRPGAGKRVRTRYPRGIARAPQAVAGKVFLRRGRIAAVRAHHDVAGILPDADGAAH